MMVGAMATAAIRAASLLMGETWVADPKSCTAWPVTVEVIMVELHVPVVPVKPDK